MYIDENKPSALATRLSAYDYVVLDTCSLMEEGFTYWLDILSQSKEYWKEGLEILIPRECLDELSKHAKDKDRESIAKRIAAKRAKKIVKHARRHRVISILKKEKGSTFADNAIYNFCNLHRLNSSVLVITQDKTLAYDLREQNHLSSQKGRYVDVNKLLPDGRMAVNKGEKPLVPYSARREPFVKKGDKPPFKKEFAPKKEIDPIVRADMRLSSNLDNPNYPVAKKIADINEQIKTLNSLPKEKLESLRLGFTVEQLEMRLAQLGAKAPAKAEAKADTKPAKSIEKPAEKPVEKAETKPEKTYEQRTVKETLKTKRPKALGGGKTAMEAVQKYCAAKGVIIRDDSIPHVPLIHGEYDITISKANEFVASLPEGNIDYTGDICGLPITLRTSGKYIDAYDPASLANETKPEIKTEVINEAKPDSKPVENPAKAEPKAKKDEKTVVIKKEDGELEVKGSNRKDVQATPRTVVPKGATLIVGGPAPKKAKAQTEKKAEPKAEAKPAKATKASETKTEAKPKAATAKKPAAKEAAPKDKAALIEEAKKADANLQSNLNNPNFPKKSALKDISAQIERLHNLTPHDRSGFKYGLRDLKARESELKKEIGEASL